MLDIGWSELLVIGIVALIVVGPKDLPVLFRRLGEFTGRMRAMAREFTSAMDRAADDAGMRDMQRELKGLSTPRKAALDAINEAARDLERWEDLPDVQDALAPKTKGSDPQADGPAPATKPDPAPSAEDDPRA